MPQSSSATLLVTALAALAGCTPASESGTPALAAPATPPGKVTMDATLMSIIEAVLADAAGRTGLDRSSLVVASAESVTWADGSLGCPQPGQTYTMALVPGYRIRIRTDRQVLDYHASERGYFVLCPPGRAVDPDNGIVM